MEPIIVLDDVDTVILHLLDGEALYIMGNSNKYVKSYILKDKQLKAKYINYRMKYMGVLNDMKRVKDERGFVEIYMNLKLTKKQILSIIPYAKHVIFQDYTLLYKVRVDEVIKSIKALLIQISEAFDINKLAQYGNNAIMIYKI